MMVIAMTKKYHVQSKYYAPLEQVATIKTVAELFSMTWGGVRYAIDADNIAAVKDGKTWLISLPSAAEYWGVPPCPIGGNLSLFGPVTALQLGVENGHRRDTDSRAQGGMARALFVLRNGIYQQAN